MDFLRSHLSYINDFLRNPHFSTYILKTWVFNIILVLHFFLSFLSTYVKRLNETKAVCRKTAKWSFQSENPKGVWKLRVDCSLSAMKPKSFWSCFFFKESFSRSADPLVWSSYEASITKMFSSNVAREYVVHLLLSL